MSEIPSLLFIASRQTGAGLRVYRFPETGGEPVPVSPEPAVPPLTALAVDRKRQRLFAAGNRPGTDGFATGFLLTFSVDPETGSVDRVDDRPSGGSTPCYLSVGGDHLWVAHFRHFGTPGDEGATSRGNVTRFRIAPEPSGLPEKREIFELPGESVHPVRQTASHPHSVVPHPTETVVFVADLGTDAVRWLPECDSESRVVSDWNASILRPPSGPRHIAIHPSGRFLYVNTEIASTVVAFATGSTPSAELLSQIDEVPAIPGDLENGGGCSELAIHPSARFLYSANRGNGAILVYPIDPDNGRPLPPGQTCRLGENPMRIAFDRTGDRAAIAFAGSNQVLVTAVDPRTGAFIGPQQGIPVTQPSWVAWVK